MTPSCWRKHLLWHAIDGKNSIFSHFQNFNSFLITNGKALQLCKLVHNKFNNLPFKHHDVTIFGGHNYRSSKVFPKTGHILPSIGGMDTKLTPMINLDNRRKFVTSSTFWRHRWRHNDVVMMITLQIVFFCQNLQLVKVSIP